MKSSVCRSSRLTIAALLVLSFCLSACGSRTADEYLSSAQSYMADNEPSAAVIELKNALRQDPDLAAARSLLGQAHFQLGDYPAALKELEAAGELGLNDATTRLTTLRTKNALGRHTEVIETLMQETALEPDFAVELGSAYLLADDLQNAKHFYMQGQDRVSGLVGLAAVARIEANPAGAKSFLDRAVAADPLHRGAWLSKADTELALRDYPAALDAFDNAGKLPGGELAGRIGKARTYLMQDQIDDAEQEVDSVLAQDTRSVAAQYLKGLIQFRRNDMKAAENALMVVQQYAPDHPPTLNLMGAVKYELQQFSQAEANLREYLTVDSRNVSARKLLAAIYNSQRKHEAAVDVLRPAAHSSTDPQLWAMLGAAELAAGQSSSAIESLQQAVLLAPNISIFRNQLALSFLSSGDTEQASAILDDAVEIGGDQFENEYLQVMLLIRDKKFDQAAMAVETLITNRPESPIGYNLQGAIAVARGDQAAAEAAFRKTLEIQPNFVPAVRSLAVIDEQKGDAAGARKRFEEALDADPYSEHLLLGYANLLARQGDGNAALQTLEKTIGANPESVPARIGQVRLLLTTGQNDRAREAADAAMKVASDVPDLLLLKAEADIRGSDFASARTVATRLQAIIRDAEPNSNLYTATGNLQNRVGNRDLARENFEAAVALGEPVPPGALAGLAQIALQDGDIELAQQNLDRLKALGLSGEAIDLLQGDLWSATGKVDVALTLYERLAAGGSRQGLSRVAALASEQQDYAKAERALKNWLQSKPEDLPVQMLLANLYMQTDREDDARTLYESMLPTKDVVALNNLAWLYIDQDIERSVEMAREANTIAPGNPNIEDTLGWVLVRAGSINEGLVYLKNAARMRPDDAAVHYHLGAAYKDAGQLTNARDSLQRAVSLGSFDELDEARALLVNLERQGVGD